MSQTSLEQRPSPNLVWLIAALMFAGCTNGDGSNADKNDGEPATIIAPAIEQDPREMTPSQLREALGIGEKGQIQKGQRGGIAIVDISNTGIRDLSPLKGLQLEVLDMSGLQISDLSPLKEMKLLRVAMENTLVDDISVLKGMPLEYLWLKDTQVSDISPLADMPLRHLNLMGTKVSDSSPVKTLKLQIIWLRDAPVTDLSPLAGSDLESLDVQDTPVANLDVVAELPKLVRLNMAGTKVTDLTPLEGRALTRLIFTPENITKGIEVIREMESLTQLDTSFDGDSPTAMSADEFWAKFDAGGFGKKPTKKPAEKPKSNDD